MATASVVRQAASWLKARLEVLVPVLGLPLFLLMAGQMDVALTGFQAALLWGAALVHAGLVVWSPMALPAKDVQPITRARRLRAALLVTAAVVGGVLLQAAVHPPSPQSESGGSLLTLLPVIVLALVAYSQLGTPEPLILASGVPALLALPVALLAGETRASER